MVLTSNRVLTNEFTISVGLGEYFVSRDPQTSLACFGLGSCICVCSHDPVSKVSGMVHIVLPKSRAGLEDRTATKYADVAIPVLFDEMKQMGAFQSRMITKVAGGAKMIRSYDDNDAFEMGLRNLQMVENLLAERNIKITSQDTGGTQGRSVWMFINTGKVFVKTAGGEAREL
ncbi:MAG: chemotaxis protein CheD [Dehalococcoidales bacterium]|nr:chemotaxis protein CheD [Dehalococcoidales bacterium]